LGLLDSDPSLFCTDPDASIHQQAKKELRKTLISTIFDFFFDFVSMKSDVNVSSKSKKKKNVHFGHLVSILSAIDEKQDPNPIRKLMVQGPRIRIRTKLSWIHNTAVLYVVHSIADPEPRGFHHFARSDRRRHFRNYKGNGTLLL
jgi:hypothetical protein